MNGVGGAAPGAAHAGLRLGVGVCALDEAGTLPRLLTRLLGAGLGPEDAAQRVVVADGGSRDGTADVARALGAEVRATGRGRGVQLGAAAEVLLAEGAPPVDVLLFLHADAVPLPGALRALRAAFGAGAEAASFRQVIEGDGRFLRAVEAAADRRVRRGMVYGDSGLALTPALYRRAGGYPNLPLFEDVALSHTLRRVGATIVSPPEARLAISARRWQKEGALRCTLRNWILRGLYEAGVPPARLVRLYRPHSNP